MITFSFLLQRVAATVAVLMRMLIHTHWWVLSWWLGTDPPGLYVGACIAYPKRE